MSPQKQFIGTIHGICNLANCQTNLATVLLPRLPETFSVNYNKPTCKYEIARVLFYLILISPDIIIQLLERLVTIKLVAMFL